MAAPSGRERPDRRQSPPSITPRDCRTTTIRRLVSVAPHPPPALSLRPILAIFGLVVCTVAAVATLTAVREKDLLRHVDPPDKPSDP